MDEKAIELVADYAMAHLDQTDLKENEEGTLFSCYIAWKAKILQNWKYLISTTLHDGMYYEVTYDGDKKRWYLDAYKKFENKAIKED